MGVPTQLHPPARRPLLLKWALICTLLCACEATAAEVSFRRDVAPILRDQCLACHNAKSAEGSYRVDTYDQLLQTGDSGRSPVQKGQKGASELFRRLTCDEFERMPADSDPLPPDQVATIAGWIESGASFDGSDSSLALSQLIPAERHPDPPAVYPLPIPATAVCFTSEGNRIVVGGYHELLVWDAAEKRLVQRIADIGQRCYAVVPCPDASENTIAVACGEPGRSGEIRLVSLHGNTVTVDLLSAEAADVVTTLAWSPDGKRVAGGSFDRTVRVFDAASGKRLRTIASHADAIYSVAFSPDGKQIVSTARDGTAKVFDLDSGKLLVSYSGHAAPVSSAVFSDDGKTVFSTSDDHQLHRWRISDGKPIAKTKLAFRPLRMTAGKDQFAVLGSDGSIQLVERPTGRLIRLLEGHDAGVVSAAFDRGGERLVSGSFAGELRLWDLAAEKSTPSSSWIAKP